MTSRFAAIAELSGVPYSVRAPSGQLHQFGNGPSRFTLAFRNDHLLNGKFDELAFARAYIQGDFEIEGDMAALMRLRRHIHDKVRLSSWLSFIVNALFKSETSVNRQSIRAHYQRGDELYLSFIDQRYRMYSQCIFQHPGESLEEASEHKLENMYKALELRPGMRLLDIGGGWGGVPEYCGTRGVKVTSLTLGEDSLRYIERLIDAQKLPCHVLLQDFLTYAPEEPFDAIVIYGVIEHIPNYRRFAGQVQKCLKPNGRLFLDGSASIVKYAVSGFARKYIWSGTHTFLCLQDLIDSMLPNGLEVLRVENESAHYGLTMQHWAQRLEQNREMVVQRWGEDLYRAFRLYLWGGSQAFPELLQAYHLVARRMPTPPPAIPRWRRMLGYVGRPMQDDPCPAES
jgi:cyclopropane-fatty-acyl-phospholipid synthase